MEFPELIKATLIQRYKRFLADVTLESGEEITVHCPNTGAMTGCADQGSVVWLSVSANPKRKYAHTWELVETGTGLARINSAAANRLVQEAIAIDAIAELRAYRECRSEVRYGEQNSRIDLLLSDPDRADCYVEVKSVTLDLGGGRGAFPDAKSSRGTKHLQELAAMCRAGARAVLFFCVQHAGIKAVSPAKDIDPVYALALAAAMSEGVEVLCYASAISPTAIHLTERLPFSL